MKKFLPVSIPLLFCAVLLCVSASAAGPAIRVGNVTVEPGKTVDMTVTLENNPGLVSMALEVTYDRSALTLTNVSDAGRLGTSNHNPNLSVYPYILSWENDTAASNYTASGTIVTLTFSASSDASGTYPIGISYNGDAGILNYDLSPVTFTVFNGTVNVATAQTQILSLTRTATGTSAAVVCSETSAAVFCAAYDSAGRMLRVESQGVRAGENSYTFSLGSAANYRVFVLKNGVPLCTSYSG